MELRHFVTYLSNDPRNYILLWHIIIWNAPKVAVGVFFYTKFLSAIWQNICWLVPHTTLGNVELLRPNVNTWLQFVLNLIFVSYISWCCNWYQMACVMFILNRWQKCWVYCCCCRLQYLPCAIANVLFCNLWMNCFCIDFVVLCCCFCYCVGMQK